MIYVLSFCLPWWTHSLSTAGFALICLLVEYAVRYGRARRVRRKVFVYKENTLISYLRNGRIL